MSQCYWYSWYRQKILWVSKLLCCSCFTEMNPGFVEKREDSDPEKTRSLWQRERGRVVFARLLHCCKQTFGLSLLSASSILAVCLTHGNTSAVGECIWGPVLTMSTHTGAWRNQFCPRSSSLLSLEGRMALGI